MNDISVQLHDDQLTQLGIASTMDFYRVIAHDEKKLSDGCAFLTGIQSPFLNVYFDLRRDRKNSVDLAEQVKAFFHESQAPWTWFIIPASKENDLKRQGFSLLEEAPALYFDLSHPLPAIKSDLITIEEVDGSDDLQAWIQPINEGFEIEPGDDHYRLLNLAVMRRYPQKIRHFVAYYKNDIAAAATLFMSEKSVMLHNLATKTKYKKRGLGTALTLHLMAQAQALQFQHCFLDASDEAFNLYQQIGFKVYCLTSIYISRVFSA